MIEDEDHPQMVRAHQELMSRLGYVLEKGDKKLDKYLMKDMYDVVKQHREQCRTRGIDFPALVALVVPRFGIVEWKRADLDLASIKVSIVNFVRFHPQVPMAEVVQTFRRAWPSLKPDDVLSPADVAVKATEDRARRKQGGESEH